MKKIEVKRDMTIMVSGKKAVVVFPSLNKVKVRFDDGTEEMISYQLIQEYGAKY